MTPPDVRVRLSAEGVAEVVSALKTIQAEGAKAAAAPTKKFGLLNGVLGNMKGLLVGAAGYFSARAMLGVAAGGARLADEMYNVSQQIGTTVERLSALNYLAVTSDVDLGMMRQSVSKLARGIADLAEGSPTAVKAFGKLGLKAKDFEGKDTAEALALVAERMARLEPGYSKTAVAQELFGKSGSRLIPMLNELGAQGLPGVIDRARELGLVLNDETAAAVESMNDDIDILKLQSDTLAAQFVGGLAPDMQVALDAISGGLTNSGNKWTIWGQVVGKVVRALGLVVGTALNLITECVDLVATTVESAFYLLRGVAEGGAKLVKGDFEGAKAEVAQGWEENERAWEGHWTRLKARAGAEWDAIHGTFTTTPEEVGPPAPAGVGGSEDGTESVLTDRLALERAALQNEVALFKANAKLREESESQAWDAGLRTVQEHFASRRQAVEDGFQAELDALRQERALLEDEPDPNKRAGEQAKVDAEIAQLRLRREQDLLQLTGDERKAVEDLAEQRKAMEAGILEAQGRRHELALAQIEKEAREYDELLLRMGVADEERARLVEGRRKASTAVADFDEAQRQAQSAMDQIDLARQDIQRQVDAGLLSEIDGQKQIAQLELGRLPNLQALADALLACAEATGDPERILRAQQFVAALKELGVIAPKVSELATAIENLGEDIKNAAVDSLANSLADIGTESKNAKQAVLSFLSSFAAAVRQVMARLLALQAVNWVEGLFGDKGEGKAEGGEIDEKHSEGGLLRGPGTGTSDSILAIGPGGRRIRFSNGEYVVRARAAQRPGALRFLHAFNAGYFDPRELLRTVDMQAFARGGVVERGMATPRVLPLMSFARGGAIADASPAPAAASLNGKVTIGLEEGLVLRALDSPDGERLIIKTLARNRRALSRIWR